MKEFGRSAHTIPPPGSGRSGAAPPGPPQRTSAESSTFSHPSPGSGSGRVRRNVPEMEHHRGPRGAVPAQDEQRAFLLEGGHLHSLAVRPGQDRIGLPDPDQFAVERKEERMVSRFPKRRVRTGAQERTLGLGIGDLPVPAEGGELLFPPFPDRLDEGIVPMMHEVEERGNLTILLPHEEERKEGGEQDDARGELQGLEADQAGEPVPAHPVPHLVVVLGKDDELPRREVAGTVPVAAFAVDGILPGVDEPIRERPGHLFDPAEVAVIPVPFPRQERVERVVKVVAPLGVEAVSPFIRRGYDPRVVQVALGDQIGHPVLFLPEVPHGPGELGKERGGAEVHDAVDRVEAQRVHVELPEPVEGVLPEIPAHLVAEGTVEVHGGPPRGAVPVAEVGAEVGKVVPLRPEVVVDHVQDDGQAAQVAGVDQAL